MLPQISPPEEVSPTPEVPLTAKEVSPTPKDSPSWKEAINAPKTISYIRLMIANYFCTVDECGESLATTINNSGRPLPYRVYDVKLILT